MRTLIAVIVLVLCAGCNGDSTGSPDGPADVRVVSASLRPTDTDSETLEVELVNRGGPGSVGIQAWGFPSEPDDPPERAYGQSEALASGCGSSASTGSNALACL